MAGLTPARESDLVVTDEAPCMFWKLPPEIRDIIYDLVYGGDRTICVMTRSGWTYREKRKLRENPIAYVVRC